MRVGNSTSQPTQEATLLPAQAEKRSTAVQGPVSTDNPPLSEAETKVALDSMNRTTEAFNVGLRFQLHEESERIMVQVVDRASDEVIKEIPPEHLLKLAAQIQDMIGLLLDTKR